MLKRMTDVMTRVIFEGCNTVVKTVCDVDFDMEEIDYACNRPNHSGPVVNIGFFGDYSGQVYFMFRDRLALKLAGSLIGGEVTDMSNDLAQSALSELCNMIMGNALGLMSKKHGVTLDITPPAIKIHDNPDMHPRSGGMVRVPLSLNGTNEINMFISAFAAS